MSNVLPLEIHVESNGERWEGVWVYRLRGREAISQPFAFEIELFVQDAGADLEAQAVSDKEVTVVIEDQGQEVRRIHGILGTVRDHLEGNDARRSYVLQILPRIHRMRAIETQEVHLDKTIRQIIEAKLDAHGFGPNDFEMRLVGTYDVREIVVQHGESDFAFVCRLAEHVGISFFFEHEDGVDKIVFTDHARGFSAVEHQDELTFHGRGEARGVYALERVRDVVPVLYFIQDYNYRTPLLDPTGSHELAGTGAGGIVEYGSHVKTPDEAARLAQVRAEEQAVRREIYELTTDHQPVSAGRRSFVLDHPRLAAREELLVVEVEHRATCPGPDQQLAEAAGYENRATAISATLTYRPPRRTPKPRMPGLVTGVIQPGANGEIGGVARLAPDGSYTVQIHFDTVVRGAQKSSHPVRMAQPFNGHGNSMHFPLLPGTEVVIAFANGDPDRPIIVGALPNPVSPSTIVAEEAHTHRIRTSQGVIVELGNTVLGRE